MLDILEYTVNGGFWHFIGCWLILALGIRFAVHLLTLAVLLVRG